MGRKALREIKLVIKFKMVHSVKNLLFSPKGEIHYIGGSEVLPPPLEASEEAKVLAQLGGEYDEKVKTLLIERNLRLVVYIAK